MTEIVVLSGGVGGGRFVRGVAELAGAESVTVIGNVGDDVESMGLLVSPDLDSVLYQLAGVFDEQRGWGRRDETWNAVETARSLGADVWFPLGDRDLGLQVVRTAALRAGEPLSSVTQRLAAALRVGTRILPATDDRLRTIVDTPDGSFEFQEWFVRRRHADPVDGIRFVGAEAARPAPGVVEALEEAEAILVAPSNPYISVWPILAVGEIDAALRRLRARTPVVGVSPLVGGRAVKGPLDRMLGRLGGGTEPAHVAACYEGLLDALVIDESDAAGAAAVEETGVRAIVARTLMTDRRARVALAEAALDAARRTRAGEVARR